ncbi:MAG TPA: DMT family transporter [Candidatus Thermoplasmatota archaeon]|nr:DMT family transporter [Candidatus Thermoplasmatota archaeon]
MRMRRQLFLPFLLVLVSFVWAGSFLVVSYATQEISPIHLGFLRFLVATPLMVLIVVLRRKPLLLPRKEVPWLIVLGLTGVTFLYLFQFIGIAETNAPTASVLINMNVIFIAILSGVFLHETLSRRRVTGIVLSFVGVIVIMLSDLTVQHLSFTSVFFIGCLLVLCSALCWALYTLVGKRLLEAYDPFVITAYAFVFGTVLYLPFVVDITPVLSRISMNGWLAVLYLALTCSIFGYLGWYYALQRIDASKAAVFLNFIPLFTILMSILLGQQLTWFFFLGAALIVYGVYITQKQ